MKSECQIHRCCAIGERPSNWCAKKLLISRSVLRMVNQPFLKPANEKGLSYKRLIIVNMVRTEKINLDKIMCPWNPSLQYSIRGNRYVLFTFCCKIRLCFHIFNCNFLINKFWYNQIRKLIDMEKNLQKEFRSFFVIISKFPNNTNRKPNLPQFWIQFHKIRWFL